jgi:hypothetical protein
MGERKVKCKNITLSDMACGGHLLYVEHCLDELTNDIPVSKVMCMHIRRCGSI